MAEATGISWAHHSWNPWVGCDKVAPGCAHCYIHRLMTKQGREPWGEIYRTKTWADPDKWQKKAEECRQVERVFSCSMSDFFHAKADGWRDEAWEIIRRTPNLVYFLLTKRPTRIIQHLPKDWGQGYSNVWLGVTVVCKRDISNMDVLREVPVHSRAIRALSCEPLLDDISQELNLDGFGWVAVGGESGSGDEYLWNPNCDWQKELQETPGRRTMKLEWAEKIRDKTKSAGLPFVFKQVTSPLSGVGLNALGRSWHEYPPPPLSFPWRPQPAIEAKHLYSIQQLEHLDIGGRPITSADHMRRAFATMDTLSCTVAETNTQDKSVQERMQEIKAALEASDPNGVVAADFGTDGITLAAVDRLRKMRHIQKKNGSLHLTAKGKGQPLLDFRE